MINIVIPEETPSLNKGESAILFGMIESFKVLDDTIKLSMLSFDMKSDIQSYKERVHIMNASGIMPSCIMFKDRSFLKKINEYITFCYKHFLFLLLYKLLGKHALKLFKRDVWNHYLNADIVIMAHDSIFSPIYHSILSVFFKSLKKKIVVYGASFPPIKNSTSLIKRLIYNNIIKIAFSNIDLITLREEISMKYINSLKLLKTPTYLTGDFAFLVHPASVNIVDEIMNKEKLIGGKPIIGFTVSHNKVKFSFSKNRSYKDKEEKFVKETAHIIDQLITDYDAIVAFIPHSILKDEQRDDRIIAQKIYNVAKHKKHIRLVTDNYTSEELKGLTGRFEFCIGTRLHFIIDAISMLVPSIIWTDRFDQRVHGIIGNALGCNQSIFDIEEMENGNFLSMIKARWEDRAKTKETLAKLIPIEQDNTLSNGKLLKNVVIKHTIEQ